MQQQFKQIIDYYESQWLVIGFIQNYKERPLDELEQILLEFQSLYSYGDTDGDRDDLLIEPQDWMIFSHWEPCTQAEFLAYLAIKIAFLRQNHLN